MAQVTRQHTDTKQTQQQKPPQPTTEQATTLLPDAPMTEAAQARVDPRAMTPRNIAALQRTVGNRAVQRLVQRKLTARERAPGDRYEQEADAVATQVMTMPEPQSTAATCTAVQRQGMPEEDELQAKPLIARAQREAAPEEDELQAKPLLQRQAMPEEDELQAKPLAERVQRAAEEDELQTKPLIQRAAEEDELQAKPLVQRKGDGGFETNDAFAARVQKSHGGGSPLSNDTRDFMESRMGADFSDVRVHTGGEAAQLSREVQAQAFTHGQDIYLGEEKSDFASGEGKRLLAHELTHTIQQGGAPVQPQPQPSQIDHSQTPVQRIVTGIVQRDIPSKAQWKTNSAIEGAWVDWRSTEMNAIGNVVGAYHQSPNDEKSKMQALLAILTAISAWQLSKDQSGGNLVAKTTPTQQHPHDARKRSAAVDGLLTEIKLEVHKLLAAGQEKWDEKNFTKPTEHDANNFQYLVNGIQEYGDKEPQYITDVLSDPTNIKNALISISIISDAKTPLWCPSGFILKVPKENIVSAKHEDLATDSKVSQYHDVEIYKEVARLFSVNGIPAPAELLDKTKQDVSGSKHNEIAALGQGATGKETEVIGIFIVASADEPDSPIMIGQQLEDDEIPQGKPPTVKVGNVHKKVMKKTPGVSKARMKIYAALKADKKLPIVYIPMAANANFSSPRFSVWDDKKFVDLEEVKDKKLWG